MKRSRVPVLIGAAFLAFVIVATAAIPAQTLRTASDDIAKLRAEWVKDLRTKQLDPIANLYSEDAVFVQPTGARITGRPAIRELCKNIMATFTSDITLHPVTNARSGNLAYESGDFSETLTNVSDGNAQQSSGAYVMMYKRQPNGVWLIAEQVWVGAPPESRLPTPGSETTIRR
jgi:uncharacterized protein (TIGR02246 family)